MEQNMASGELGGDDLLEQARDSSDLLEVACNSGILEGVSLLGDLSEAWEGILRIVLRDSMVCVIAVSEVFLELLMRGSKGDCVISKDSLDLRSIRDDIFSSIFRRSRRQGFDAQFVQNISIAIYFSFYVIFFWFSPTFVGEFGHSGTNGIF